MKCQSRSNVVISRSNTPSMIRIVTQLPNEEGTIQTAKFSLPFVVAKRSTHLQTRTLNINSRDMRASDASGTGIGGLCTIRPSVSSDLLRTLAEVPKKMMTREDFQWLLGYHRTKREGTLRGYGG